MYFGKSVNLLSFYAWQSALESSYLFIYSNYYYNTSIKPLLLLLPNISLCLNSELFHRHLNAAEVADESCGGGVLWRQRWTNTEEQESKQGTDTPSLWKVIAAYYLYLELSVLRSSLRVAHEDDKRNNHNGTKK